MSTPAQPVCPSCRSPHLSPPGDLKAGTDGTHIFYLVDDGSWIGTSLSVDLYTRICGNCGYVSMFASPDSMPALRQRWQQLKPSL